MSDIWSKKVQSTELLYYSRLEKFNEENCRFWFDRLKVKDNMKVLEVGCGGGLFTNMIKKHFPSCEVVGIDLDENHINFARDKAKELNLDVEYKVCDIKNMPFEDNSFDLVFSHTVVEHLEFNDFISEQKRVLKSGGSIVIMRVNMEEKIVDKYFTDLENEVNEVYGKLVIEASPITMAKYLESPNLTAKKLSENGFDNIQLYFDRVVYYAPDFQQSREVALSQIKRNYETKLYMALHTLQKSKNGKEYQSELLGLLERQYKLRLEKYDNNEKLFDYQSSNMITLSAIKN